MPQSPRYPDSPVRRQRRRRTHQRIDSYGEAAVRSRRRDERDNGGAGTPSPSKNRPKGLQQSRRSSRDAAYEVEGSPKSTALSSERLARLDRLNDRLVWDGRDGSRRQPAAEEEATNARREDDAWERDRRERERERHLRRLEREERKRQRREGERAAAVEESPYEDTSTESPRRPADPTRAYRDDTRKTSGHRLEQQIEYRSEKEPWRDDARRRHGSNNTHHSEEATRRKRIQRIRYMCIGVAIIVLILVIAIPVGVIMSRKSKSSSHSANSNLSNITQSSIPKWARGGYLDPFDWYDTTDFNLTFTDATVGGLYVMGLNSTWDDNTRANENVPRLNEKWDYGTMPFRGVNLGGWLSIEPFITPSLFSGFDSSAGVVDEWTLSQTLGSAKAKSTIEKHYSEWVQESTFAEIQAAGFDHIRIPFSYWAVTIYTGDPYVLMISWRYLLRGIEWARKYGLRINLDLHGAPGSQNGWNHSGHQGLIGWLNGTDGTLNGQRTIDIHKQLSTFFSQPRYKNIVTMYGLVNEPRMISLPKQKVLDWSKNAISTIRAAGYNNLIIMGDGFLGLQNWQGQMQDFPDLVLDAHQYVIFNTDLLVYNHHNKINFACGGWSQQTKQSINKATGFGPTMFGEWSQADTDCTQYLNDVGVGSRWEGTLNEPDTPGGSTSGAILTPTCPTNNNPPCSCAEATADPATYSEEYKQWLLTFAEAQMFSFELGWGWFYWTWRTESATQWSYRDGLAAGILPKLAWKRSWNCNMSVPAFGSDVLPEYY